MARTNIEKLRYLKSYSKAPKAAEYIVRFMGDDSVILEHYYTKESQSFGHSETLAEFKPELLGWDKESYIKVLEECRELVDKRVKDKVIYCEWPEYLNFSWNNPRPEIF